MAKLLGWRTIVADARPRFATPERLPSADELLVAVARGGLRAVAARRGTAIVVLTHDDKFDLPLVQARSRRDAFYVGWLGSRRNQERRRGAAARGRRRGGGELDRIAGPSRARHRRRLPRRDRAVSILAEILAVRAPAAPAGPLRDAKSRIHGEPLAGKK